MYPSAVDVVWYLMVFGVVAGIIAVGYVVRSDQQESKRKHRQHYEETRVKPHKPRS